MIQVNTNGDCISVKIKGKIESGYGESSQWMKQYIPWLVPGTLNVRLEKEKPLINYTTVIDTHFKFPCKIASCKINNTPAYIILPPLVTDNLFFVEIGANFNIRQKFNLTNTDTVTIEFDSI